MNNTVVYVIFIDNIIALYIIIETKIICSGRCYGYYTKRAEGKITERIAAGQHTGAAYD